MVLGLISCLLFMFGMLFFCFKGKISYFGMLLLTILVAIPDLYYVPSPEFDLYKYYKYMQIVRPLNNFSQVIKTYDEIPFLIHQKYSIIYNIIQWLISKTGIFSLLPFLMIIIVYFCISIPPIHERLKYNVSLISTIFIILASIFLFSYINVSSVTRWNLASGLFFLITYMLSNIKNYYRRILILPLYLLVFLIHEGTIIPILIILLCVLIPHIRLKHLIFIMLCMLFFMFIVLPKYSESNEMLRIASGYNRTQSSILGASGIVGIIYALLPIIIPFTYGIGDFIILKHYNIKTGINTNLFWTFNLLMLCFIPNLVLFNRYVLDVGVINIIFYLNIIKEKKDIPPMTYLLFSIAMLLSVIVYFYSTFDAMSFDFSHIYEFLY